jgi:hypothetical protein
MSGHANGAKDGAVVGDGVGLGEGNLEGVAVGSFVGIAVGAFDGICVGERVGSLVGDGVGKAVGEGVGPFVGLGVGESVGDGAGLTVEVHTARLSQFPPVPQQISWRISFFEQIRLPSAAQYAAASSYEIGKHMPFVVGYVVVQERVPSNAQQRTPAVSVAVDFQSPVTSSGTTGSV